MFGIKLWANHKIEFQRDPPETHPGSFESTRFENNPDFFKYLWLLIGSQNDM